MSHFGWATLEVDGANVVVARSQNLAGQQKTEKLEEADARKACQRRSINDNRAPRNWPLPERRLISPNIY